jgi:phosphomannomutase
MKAFHAYDIRGIYNTEFNKNDVYKIGFFLPKLLNASKVLIGYDARISSPEIFEYLSKGIIDSGNDVYNAGLCTTPMIYWGTAKFDFDASVMITASHNSKEYNGLKISRTEALPVGYDTGLDELEKMIAAEKVEGNPVKGNVHQIDIKTDYLKFQQQFVKDISNLKVGIDGSNGMAGLLVRDLLGNAPLYINEELDGTFPNHEPNPLVEVNRMQLAKLVLEKKLDVGVIYDGDADRVMFLDENGNFVSPDLIIALLGHYFIEEKGLKGNVLQDIRSSKSIGEYLEPMGGEINTWKVGRAYAALKLREIDGIFGGELAGHYYFKDFYYSDSGIMASLIVLGLLSKFKKEGKNFSDIIANISNYYSSGEINFRIEDKKGAMDELKKYFEKTENLNAFFDFDGYRLEFKDWWFNIRPSNTEPYLRLIVEANKQDLLHEKTNILKNLLSKFE